LFIELIALVPLIEVGELYPEVYLAGTNGKENTMRVKKFLWFVAASALFVCSVMAGPIQQDQQPAPDNTKTNQGDASKGATTADQQKMNPADRATTKQIRSALMQDKALSTYAHNIKVITQDGHVTLKGPVRTEDEKTAIGEKATQIAGAGNVTNHLKVAPPTQ
jgi:hyperosmotically inducible protein